MHRGLMHRLMHRYRQYLPSQRLAGTPHGGASALIEVELGPVAEALASTRDIERAFSENIITLRSNRCAVGCHAIGDFDEATAFRRKAKGHSDRRRRRSERSDAGLLIFRELFDIVQVNHPEHPERERRSKFPLVNAAASIAGTPTSRLPDKDSFERNELRWNNFRMTRDSGVCEVGKGLRNFPHPPGV
jgi:hypothetical protein